MPRGSGWLGGVGVGGVGLKIVSKYKMKYAAPKFRKRHEIDRLTRIHKEPRFLKQKERMQSTAWKNYFFSQVETNDISNEIKRMEGHIDHMIRPVAEEYLKAQKKKLSDKRKELFRRPVPPPTMY